MGSPGQEVGLALGSQSPFHAGPGEKWVTLPSCRVQAGAWLPGPGIQDALCPPFPDLAPQVWVIAAKIIS